MSSFRHYSERGQYVQTDVDNWSRGEGGLYRRPEKDGVYKNGVQEAGHRLFAYCGAELVRRKPMPEARKKKRMRPD